MICQVHKKMPPMNGCPTDCMKPLRPLLTWPQIAVIVFCVPFYEFHYGRFLDMLKAASVRGVDVKVVYGGIPEYKTINETAIAAAGIQNLCFIRDKEVKQPHNKFMILLKNGVRVKILTGSTNISVVGIFGHSNAGILLMIRLPPKNISTIGPN